MGFMEGFGSAFARSFENTRAQNAQDKQDAFRMTYQDYLERRRENDKWKREDSLAIRKAQEYEKMYDLPSGAWTQIYSWVKSGEDSSDIQKWITKGSWSQSDTPSTPETPKTGMDSQMEQTGLSMSSPRPPETPQNQPKKSGGLLGDIASRFVPGLAGNRQERNQTAAVNRVADMTGTTPEEVQGTMGGYTPPPIPQTGVTFRMPTLEEEERDKDPFSTNFDSAMVELRQAETAAGRDPSPKNEERYRAAQERVQAMQDAILIKAEADAKSKGLSTDGASAGVWRNGEYIGHTRVKRSPDGTMVDIMSGEPIDGDVIPVTKEEADAREALWKQIEKPLGDLRTKGQNAKGAVMSSAIMGDIVARTNGEVLKPVTSGVFQWADKNIRDVAAFAEKINQSFASGQTKELTQQSYEALINAEKSLQSIDQNSLGAQKALFETQKAILAYRIGMAMGQEGRGLAEAERKMFTDMAAAGVSVDQFYQGMSNLLVPMVLSVDSETKALLENADSGFEDTWKYKPNFMKYSSLAEELKTDPEVGPMWNEILPMTRVGLPVQKPANETGSGSRETSGSEVPVISSPDEARKLPSGTLFRTPDGKLRRVP